MAERILVVGAGPAGITAALAAAGAGARVVLADALPEPGGQIWRGAWGHNPGGVAGRAFRALKASRVDLRMERRVVTAPGPGRLGLLGPQGAEVLAYDKLILATGARERFLPFPGWTLPGVVGAGGLQALAKEGLAMEGRRVVVAGSGPLLLAAAAYLKRRGARILMVAEQASYASLARLLPGVISRPKLLIQSLGFLGLPFSPGSWATRAEGDGRLRAVQLSTPAGPKVLEADYLACGFHLVPSLELAELLGCATLDGAVRVDALQRTSIPGLFAAGESTGIGGVDKALAEGRVAGLAAAGLEAEALGASARAIRTRTWGRLVDAAFALRPELRNLPEPSTLVCRCEEVPFSALEGFAHGRDARLHTRCGMGLCQARTCGPATRFLFDLDPGGPRQPLVPATFHELLGAFADTEEP